MIFRYLHPVVSDNKLNPEFPNNMPVRRSTILDAQLYSLRTSISQLKNAYNGLDVEWSDQGTFPMIIAALDLDLGIRSSRFATSFPDDNREKCAIFAQHKFRTTQFFLFVPYEFPP